MTTPALLALADHWTREANIAEINSLEADSIGLREAADASHTKSEWLLYCASKLRALAAPAAGDGELEWRWVDEKGRAMTEWKQSEPPPMSAVSDSKGTMRVETRSNPPLQVGYDRDLIIDMLSAFVNFGAAGNGYKLEAVHEQIGLLRAADNRDALSVHTAKREPQVEDIVAHDGKAWSPAEQAQACAAGGSWPCNLPAEHAGPHRTDKSVLQQVQQVEGSVIANLSAQLAKLQAELDHEKQLRCLDNLWWGQHCAASLTLAAPGDAEAVEISPEFTDTARAALAWVLWHHQGGSSPVGQPIRFALGMGQYDELPDWRIADAKRWAELSGSATTDFHRPAPPVVGEVCNWYQDEESWNDISTGCGNSFILIEASDNEDGKPVFPHCPYCANPTIFHRWRDEQECECSAHADRLCEGCVDRANTAALGKGGAG